MKKQKMRLRKLEKRMFWCTVIMAVLWFLTFATLKTNEYVGIGFSLLSFIPLMVQKTAENLYEEELYELRRRTRERDFNWNL